MTRFVFDPEVIHECAMKGIGRRKPEMFDVIAREIEKRYPGHIDHSQPWIYSIAGGAMIQMKLYFASMREYVMIWGTPIGSEGHSGRHRAAFWDTVIDGETWYFAEGQFEKRIYRRGPDPRGQGTGLRNELHRRRVGRGIRARRHPAEHAVRALGRAAERAGSPHGGADAFPVHEPHRAPLGKPGKQGLPVLDPASTVPRDLHELDRPGHHEITHPATTGGDQSAKTGSAGRRAAGGGAANEPPAAAGHHGEGGSLFCRYRRKTRTRSCSGSSCCPSCAPSRVNTFRLSIARVIAT